MGGHDKKMNSRIEVPVFGRRVEGCPYIVRPSAYGLVRNPAGNFAVARTETGYFLPGGGLKAGESPQQAVEREAMEECGLVVRARSLLGRAVQIVYSAQEKACFEKQSTFLEADLLGLESHSNSDHQLDWLSVQEAVKTLSHESHRWALERLIQKKPHNKPLQTYERHNR